MSAFIVSESCMDRVVEAVLEDNPRYEPLFAGISKTEPAAADRIGQALYALNQRAVRGRYPDELDFAAIPAYRHLARMSYSLARLKSIHCLLYQCSEGEVPQEPLFQELVALGNRLAVEICKKLSDYEVAPWD